MVKYSIARVVDNAVREMQSVRKAECRNVASAIFNHQAGAVVALGDLGNVEAISVLHAVGEKATISQLQYRLRYRTRRLQRRHHWISSPSSVAQKLE